MIDASSVARHLSRLNIPANISDGTITLSVEDMGHLLEVLERHETHDREARWEAPLDPNDRYDPRNWK